MDRRAAIKFAVASALAANFSVAQAQSSNAPGDATVVRPGRLKKGGTIGLIAPASNAWEDEDIRISIDIVKSLGFRVRQGEHLFLRTNYLAGPDAERAEDVNRMFADEILRACEQVDDHEPIIMLQDYHLYLCGNMIRQSRPNAVIQHAGSCASTTLGTVVAASMATALILCGSAS